MTFSGVYDQLEDKLNYNEYLSVAASLGIAVVDEGTFAMLIGMVQYARSKYKEMSTEEAYLTFMSEDHQNNLQPEPIITQNDDMICSSCGGGTVL